MSYYIRIQHCNVKCIMTQQHRLCIEYNNKYLIVRYRILYYIRIQCNILHCLFIPYPILSDLCVPSRRGSGGAKPLSTTRKWLQNPTELSYLTHQICIPSRSKILQTSTPNPLITKSWRGSVPLRGASWLQRHFLGASGAFLGAILIGVGAGHGTQDGANAQCDALSW